MTVLDVCQSFKLTRINSHKDLMGLIVKLRGHSHGGLCVVGEGGNCFYWQ